MYAVNYKKQIIHLAIFPTIMKEKHTKFIWPVDEPFKIAYREPITGLLSLYPYIDLQWKIKIWGIAIDKRVYKLCHEPGADWNTAKNYADTLCHGYMPTTEDLDFAFAHKSGFDEIISFLRAHNVAAEPWNNGWYWSTEDQGSEATVVDMANGKAELIEKRIKNGYVRLVSHRIANKPLTVHFPLVYLDEGILKVSYDLVLARKDQLWGMQIGKKYFKLRQEPELQTWYQAQEKAKLLSTDLLRISLPKKEMFEELRKYRETTNDALMKLQAYGIETDLWEDKGWHYLTGSEYLDHYVTCQHEMIPKDSYEPCRFIGENVKHHTVML